MVTIHRQRFALYVLPFLFAATLLLDGCAIAPHEQAGGPNSEALEPRHHREQRLQTTWRGRTYQSLLQAYGTPKMIMGVPGYRPLRTSVAVYGVIDRASDCIDAFTLIADNQNGDLTVSDYFCR